MGLVDRRAIAVVVVAEHMTVELVVHTAVLDSRSLVHNQQDCMPLSRVELVAWRVLLDNWTHVLDKDRHNRQKFVDWMEGSPWRPSHNRLALEVSLARLSFRPAQQSPQLRHEKSPLSVQVQVSLWWVKSAHRLSKMFVRLPPKLQELSLEVAAAAVVHLDHKNTFGPIVDVLVLEVVHSFLVMEVASVVQ